MAHVQSLAAQAAKLQHDAQGTDQQAARPSSISEATWNALPEAARKELAQALAAKSTGRITLRWNVGSLDKGGSKASASLSLYGLGQFPTTLYPEQWTRLLDAADDIRAKLAAGPVDAEIADARARAAKRAAKAQ